MILGVGFPAIVPEKARLVSDARIKKLAVGHNAKVPARAEIVADQRPVDKLPAVQLIHPERDLELPGTNLHLAEVAPVSVDVAPQSQRPPVAQVEQIRDVIADLALDFVLEALGDVAVDANSKLPQVGQSAF